jgi:hypothetical protein
MKRVLGMNPTVLAGAAVVGLGLGYLYSKRKAAAPVSEPIRYTPSGQPLAIFIDEPGGMGTTPPVLPPPATWGTYPFLTGGTPGGVPHGQPNPGGGGDPSPPGPDPTQTKTVNLGESRYWLNAPGGTQQEVNPEFNVLSGMIVAE